MKVDKTMNERNGGLWVRCGLVSLLLLAAPLNTRGAERRFLVILANSPKQFPGGTTVPNRSTINRQYFDLVAGNDVDSFAEYWEEISYGDVTITGETHGWLDLPWPITPPPRNGPNGGSPTEFLDLNANGLYEFGVGERIRNNEVSVIVDTNGDPLVDNGPFARGPGSFDKSQRPNCSPEKPCANRSVWRPGERFVDVDDDGRWDGWDENKNWMDWNGDQRPDRRGPWIDLNEDFLAQAGTGCIYLPDSDNDGNPDCCPNGPTDISSCLAFPAPNACPPTRWQNELGNAVTDCNGNLIDDAVDIARGTSKDVLPMRQEGTSCTGTTVNGVPDECEFTGDSLQRGCTDSTGGSGNDNPCRQLRTCFRLPPAAARTMVERCEFDDADENRVLGIVEPFENFLRRWDPCLEDPDASSDVPDTAADAPHKHWIKVYDPSSPNANLEQSCSSLGYSVKYSDPSYITNNYPGNPAPVIAQATSRRIYGQHDPLRRISSPTGCRCAIDINGELGGTCKDLDLNRNNTIEANERNLCLAGIHASYDPPDRFDNFVQDNRFTAKMQFVARDTGGPKFFTDSTITPKPAWYQQAWEDRYGDECYDTAGETVDCVPPPWPGSAPDTGTNLVPVMVPYADANPATFDPLRNRRYFKANFGGLDGLGTGWIGEDFDRVAFEIGNTVDGFELEFNRQILPEEVNGEQQVGVFYDGYVEFDDLPSSKYHLGGDEWLGEITSPYITTLSVQGIDGVPAIWGHDRGRHNPDGAGGMPDFVIPAAGPYATGVHGTFGRDGGNVMMMELLTWRRDGKHLNNGIAWERTQVSGNPIRPDLPPRTHPYAGPSGENLGYRDYNLDGLLDMGETRPAGSENYVVDADPREPSNGTRTFYPYNRRRLWEDAVAILDENGVDFDTFVDVNSMATSMNCSGESGVARVPASLGDGEVRASGFASGIILLPAGATADVRLPFLNAGSHYAIHNEDGLNDPNFPNSQLPRNSTIHQVNWNVFFNDLVWCIGGCGGGGGAGNAVAGSGEQSQTGYSAHEYLHTWQRFPDLYDYDVYDLPGPEINCAISIWDIMSEAGLVHPTPILKESSCTRWVKPIDLTTVLTPGVEKVVTLPAAEFVRDGYYFLENDLFLENGLLNRERFYFWSAGSGFDERFPGAGLLILHSDVDANSDSPPPQNRLGSHFTYTIVQADGLDELAAGHPDKSFCVAAGDAGDPFPGSTNNTRFNCSSNPSARWYNGNACSGLDIYNIQPDAAGSMRMTVTWLPTAVPSLRFIDPPGGTSVGTPPQVTYNIRAQVTDRYGGTTINFYYTTDENNVTIVAGAGSNRIGTVRKQVPGSTNESINWNIANRPDGRYFIFAELVPGVGEQQESSFSPPRPSRNNEGDGTLSVRDVARGKARLETWKAECTHAAGNLWRITSSITQPDPSPGQPTPQTYVAQSGVEYTSVGGEVRLLIMPGNVPFRLGDSFTFTTTGITAPSRPITILRGRISEGPTSIISASRLSGDPPLRVEFDGRNSADPNGEPLNYRWDFGDGSALSTGAQVSHIFTQPRTFTVTLRVTNPRTGLFDESQVDIAITNNPPNAVIRAEPISGQAPLEVSFSAGDSSDRETPADRLTYKWDFGDGSVANSGATPGTQFASVDHLYNRTATGRACTSSNPCNFTAVLTVTDEGGKSDTDSVEITLGNSRPAVTITTSATTGIAPLDVVFNGLNSIDPDGDLVCIQWIWGDSAANECHRRTGPGNAADGNVTHRYQLPTGETSKTYQSKAVVFDYPGQTTGTCTCEVSATGTRTEWPGVNITVTQATPGSSAPVVNFTVTPATPVLNQPFTVDATASFDRPQSGRIASYSWTFGDGSSATGVTATHTYSQPGTYRITLVVTDAETPPNTASRFVAVTVVGDGTEPPAGQGVNRAPLAVFTVAPASAGIGDELRFDARGSSDPDVNDTLTFEWSFGDGTAAQGAQTTHRYSRAGTFTVRLTVKDNRNAATHAIQTVRVSAASNGNQMPVVVIATGPRSGIAPLTLTFDARNSYDPDNDTLSFRWEFMRDGSLDGQTMSGALVSRTFVTPGSYIARLTITDADGLTTTSTQIVEVFERGTGPSPGDNDNFSDDDPPVTRPDNNSSSQNRPSPFGFCGLGLLPALLGSYIGLLLTAASRRKGR